MAAIWKKTRFDLTRIQSHDTEHKSPICYLRANAPSELAVLIYNIKKYHTICIVGN